MKKISMTYYKKFLIFYIVYLGLFIGMSFLFDRPESKAVFIVIFRFFGLFMVVIGIYAVSFIYGIFFQFKNRLEFSKILLLSGLLFLIGILAFSPWWLSVYSRGYKYALYYLLEQASLQAFSFFAGSLIVKFVVDFNQRKTIMPPN